MCCEQGSDTLAKLEKISGYLLISEINMVREGEGGKLAAARAG